MKAITNRRLIKDDEKYKFSLLDTNLISDEANEAGFGIGAAIATALGQISTALPQLGFGKKSRMQEADNAAENAQNNARLLMEAEDQKSDNLKKLVLIVGVLVFLVVIVAVALRK